MRYELSDYEWASIKPFLPNKPRGVPRVNDRRVLNGIRRFFPEERCDLQGCDLQGCDLPAASLPAALCKFCR
jgi:hypothetical protein